MAKNGCYDILPTNSPLNPPVLHRCVTDMFSTIILCYRTFGPFLANYYINPHAPAIRMKDKPRVDLKKAAADRSE